jgi:hypothetical protein
MSEEYIFDDWFTPRSASLIIGAAQAQPFILPPCIDAIILLSRTDGPFLLNGRQALAQTMYKSPIVELSVQMKMRAQRRIRGGEFGVIGKASFLELT